MNQIELFKVRDFSALINDTFLYIRNHFKGLIKSMLYICGPFILLQSFLISSMSFIQTEEMTPVRGALLLVVMLLMIIFSLFSYNFIVIVPLEYVRIHAQNKTASAGVKEVWNAVKQDFWMVTLTHIGIGFFCFLGYLFFMIPGIYLVIVMSLMPVMRIWERQGFGEAYTRSRQLIKNHWWFTAAFIFLLSMIATTLVFIFMMPYYVISFLEQLHTTTEHSLAWVKWISIVITAVTQMASSFSSMIAEVGISLQFFNLRERKEATGLLSRIEQLGDDEIASHA